MATTAEQKAKKVEYNRQYRKANREKCREQENKRRQQKNANGFCRNCSEPLAENSGCYCPKHAAENAERLAQIDPVLKLYYSIGRNFRSGRRNYDQAEFVAWYNSQPRTCCYCGIDVATLGYTDKKQNALTIDRKDSSKGYEPGNVCLCCFKCNSMKKQFFTYDEWLKIAIEVIRPRLDDYHPQRV